MPNPATAKDDSCEFLDLACLNYSNDHQSRREQAQELLNANPKIALQNIWSAAATANQSELTQQLARDPSLATKIGGPRNWPPLLYACYSRVFVDAGSSLATVQTLLAAGADPNTHFMWGGQYRFTALTGVFGFGESGPKQQPPHPECEQLARCLLTAGADPNDSQALYNCMFQPGSFCLDLLLEFGLNDAHKNNWLLNQDGEWVSHPDSTLHYQLRWAINNYHSDRVEKILNAGINVGSAESQSSGFLKMARLAGHERAVSLLRSLGACEPNLTPMEQFTADCLAGDFERAKEQLSVDSKLLPQLLHTHGGRVMDAVSAGRLEPVKTLLALGLPVNLMTSASLLHQAAWAGQQAMVQMLLEHGAERSIRDKNHDATPADWARYAGHDAVADFIDNWKVPLA